MYGNFNAPYGYQQFPQIGMNPVEAYVKGATQAQNQPFQTQQPQFIARAGTIEEAKGFIADPLANNLFVDLQSGKVHLKRMSNNGTSEMFTFSLDQPQEHELVKKDPLELINERLDRIEKLQGGQHVQPNANDTATNATAESAIIQ